MTTALRTCLQHLSQFAHEIAVATAIRTSLVLTRRFSVSALRRLPDQCNLWDESASVATLGHWPPFHAKGNEKASQPVAIVARHVVFREQVC
jgi:hypothetical protein